MLNFTNFGKKKKKKKKNRVHAGIRNCSTLEDDLQEIIYNIIYFTGFIQ